ncbi:MAG TPA: nucleotidyltransferase [Terriglobales bacterium]|nr:nucleotidyltransferase [Terriglobales bacterium]
MAVSQVFDASENFTAGLDELLFEICEDLQLSGSRYDLAVERYNTLNRVLESTESPFRFFKPDIYPQGSMALGTTVKPLEGPHDLDFVLQLSRNHNTVDPMILIRTLYGFLKGHGTYGSVVTPKNRCVRITYADEFYMDVLPACHNAAASGTCIKVPDRALKTWSDSNPIGYVGWFRQRSKILRVDRVLDRAAPVPPQQAVSEKSTLQLVVQLVKRWRDLYYTAGAAELAPISVVLTTLAAHCYQGERSVSSALTKPS